MANSLPFSPANKYAPYIKAIFILLVIVYLVNILSPLRLHVDTLRYFGIKDCWELGCDPNSFASQDYLPYGYTALLYGLSKIGLLYSWSIILINCIYLFVSLYIIKNIFGSKLNGYLFGIAVLLSWTTIKFVVHPLSEMQYVFVSVVSLYFFYRYTVSKKILFLLGAFLFGVLAFFTRTVGIALFAALFAGILWEYRKQIINLIRKHKVLVLIGAGLLVLTVLFSKQLGLNHYTGVLSKQFEEGASVLTVFKWHFQEWAEIVFNISMAKVNGFIPATITGWVFTLLGVLCFGTICYFFFSKNNNIPVIIKIYILFYSILMFNWPFYDPRFWVPVLPLIFAGVLVTPLNFNNNAVLKFLKNGYVVFFIVLGLAAIGFMSSTSLNKKEMIKKQANGVYRNEYETSFYGKPLSDTAKQVDTVIVSVLNRHN